jgi:hypothetical protein
MHLVLIPWLPLATVAYASAQPITAGGRPAQLDVRAAGEHSLRVTLKPLGFAGDFPATPALAERSYPAPAVSLRDLAAPAAVRVGTLRVEVRPDPLTVVVTNAAGQSVQTLVFEPDGNLSFGLDGQPVLGMGEGGPLPAPGSAWRSQAVQFDRRGQPDAMEPRWQADMYGSRNPAAMLLGTGGWGLFVATPWVQVDMRRDDRGLFIPWKPPSGSDVPQTRENQRESLGKGVHPVRAARGLGTQYLWGRDMLIAPVFAKGALSRAVYLPAGKWYDWWTDATHAGGQTITRAVDLATMPIFVRAGAIIPLDPVRQYTSQVVGEPTTLRVYRGADGQYTLFEDDGISQDYLAGKGVRTRMTWNERSARLTVEPGPPAGATNLAARRTFRVELIPDGATRIVQLSGGRVDVKFDSATR